jgi:ubiquitin C-terminal hydrolase
MLCALLDGLHEDLARYETRRPVPTSIIGDIFYGSMLTRLTCPACRGVQEVVEPFLFLSLPIPEAAVRSVGLRDCINGFLKSEVLLETEKWLCPKCSNKVRATKATAILKAPKICIFHLKRFYTFRGIAKKITTPVDYPAHINMAEFSRTAIGTFALVGLVLHSGGLTFGHYTAAARDPISHKWYSFNDDCVSEAPDQTCCSSRVYLLLYQDVSTA